MPALAEGQWYHGRSLDSRPISFTIDTAAYEILQRCCVKKRYGAFLSRLLYEHVARLEERQRLREAVLSVVDASGEASDD